MVPPASVSDADILEERCTASSHASAYTTGRSFSQIGLPSGVPSGASPCGTFNRASRIRMPLWNGLTARSVMKCWMPTSLSRWTKCERLPRRGCGSTTRSGPMTRWTGYPRPRFGLTKPSEVLLCHCLLDGEAYGCTRVFMRISVSSPLVAVGRVLLLRVEDYHRPGAEGRRRDRTAAKRSSARRNNVRANRRIVMHFAFRHAFYAPFQFQCKMRPACTIPENHFRRSKSCDLGNR